MAIAAKQDAGQKARALVTKAKTEHRDLTGAYIAAVVAALVMGYVTSVAKPGAVHAVLAILSVAAVIWGYLLVARSKADSSWKVVTLIAALVLAGLCFAGVSTLIGSI
jgi:hypothetical protein